MQPASFLDPDQATACWIWSANPRDTTDPAGLDRRVFLLFVWCGAAVVPSRPAEWSSEFSSLLSGPPRGPPVIWLAPVPVADCEGPVPGPNACADAGAALGPPRPSHSPQKPSSRARLSRRPTSQRNAHRNPQLYGRLYNANRLHCN